ncbi:MAG TPA: VWA domain-containing protein [Acidisarcina sp.]|nr:VWA domain-containing protein [Acidisarcina sp.]
MALIRGFTGPRGKGFLAGIATASTLSSMSSPGFGTSHCGTSYGALRMRLVMMGLALALAGALPLRAQEDTLNKVHIDPPVPPPATAASPATAPTEPTVAAADASSLRARPGQRIRVDVNLVLVPVTVTDPLNRLVTGLDREDFFVYDNNSLQKIKSFSCEDAPVSIGIVFDLSGSMSNKVARAKDSIIEFLKTANPQDEFFVIGFNDRPELIEDFTSSIEDIQARLMTVRAGHRTALLDAIYFGMNKMKQAKYERKAILVVSDGGDNRSRYTEGEVRSQVREGDVQMYSIGIFDPYAATTEEKLGPMLLQELSEETGGRLFKVDDLADMGDMAIKISVELRNEYVIGYNPNDTKRDGKWRKLKVKLVPPQGLPPLTVHARTGYYAPLQ